jgi:leucyl/phenylalanyl-tRNA--protein transferase
MIRLHPAMGVRFPPVESATPEGLLAVGGDLSSERLLEAYRRGIFPWYNPGQPILWWSPDPRAVLYPENLKISRSLRKTLRRGHFRLSFDSAFRDVMLACAAPRTQYPGGGTWITDDMLDAYCQLHDLGVAHSVEVWRCTGTYERREAHDLGDGGDRAMPGAVTENTGNCLDNGLVGGLYGVALGGVFFGESMFSRDTDASKVALVALARALQNWGFRLIDCQMPSAHLASLGAEEIPRQQFLMQLERALKQPDHSGPWQVDMDTRMLADAAHS